MFSEISSTSVPQDSQSQSRDARSNTSDVIGAWTDVGSSCSSPSRSDHSDHFELI